MVNQLIFGMPTPEAGEIGENSGACRESSVDNLQTN
jgi:hypothetical protein